MHGQTRRPETFVVFFSLGLLRSAVERQRKRLAIEVGAPAALHILEAEATRVRACAIVNP